MTSQPYRDSVPPVAPVLRCLFCGGAIAEKTCTSCGADAPPADAARASALSVTCPRCFIGLEHKKLPEGAGFLYCIGCHGCFVPPLDFGEIIEQSKRATAEEPVAAEELKPLPASQGLTHGALASAITCPVCSAWMKRVSFPGVREDIDVCGLHGIWFDAAELTHVLRESARPPADDDAEPPSAVDDDPHGALATIARFLIGV